MSHNHFSKSLVGRQAILYICMHLIGEYLESGDESIIINYNLLWHFQVNWGRVANDVCGIGLFINKMTNLGNVPFILL